MMWPSEDGERPCFYLSWKSFPIPLSYPLPPISFSFYYFYYPPVYKPTPYCGWTQGPERKLFCLLHMQKKKKKIVFSFPSWQPDGEGGQPVGIEEETSKNEVRTTRKSNRWCLIVVDHHALSWDPRCSGLRHTAHRCPPCTWELPEPLQPVREPGPVTWEGS